MSFNLEQENQNSNSKYSKRKDRILGHKIAKDSIMNGVRLS